MKDQRPLKDISDDELLRRLTDLTQRSRRVEADLVAHIAEVDERKLYAREAAPSMFAYCTSVLHLSEAEAYLRIAAARASRRFPSLLVLLAEGRLHLTGVAKLAPHLTQENAEGVLKRATYRSKRQIEDLVAELSPRPDVPAVVRRLPTGRQDRPALPGLSPQREATPPSLELGPDRATATAPRMCQDPAALDHPELRPDAAATSEVAPPFPPLPVTEHPFAPAFPEAVEPTVPTAVDALARALPTIVQPLAPGRYKVQFTASAELRDKLERLQGLMLSQVPNGDLAEVIDRAVTETLDRLEARRFARSKEPRKEVAQSDTAPTSRRLPAAVKRFVYERDGGRCRYVDGYGRRYAERTLLEYHHRLPFGMGGDHRPTNVSLVCRTHNQYMADHDYGRQTMTRHRSSSRRAPSET